MIIRGVGVMTNLALAATRGRVVDRGAYIVVADPKNPGSIYDNALVLPAAPSAAELARWHRTLADELPAIRHVTLQWEAGEVAVAAELRTAGFAIDTYDVMIADEPLAADPDRAGVRALAADEVLAAAEIAWAIAERHDDAYRAVIERRAEWHRELVARGDARFWGAYHDGQLVASVGLAPVGAVARYQDVQTLAAFRRRGFASALLATAARDAFARGAERLAIVAEVGSDAGRLYARLGFRVVERIVTASRLLEPNVSG